MMSFEDPARPGQQLDEVTTDEWEPPAYLDFTNLRDGTVYVVPSRRVQTGEVEKTVFPEALRLLPKFARLNGLDLEFLPMDAKREFLSEFSADHVWELTLAIVGIWNDWLLMAVNLWLTERMNALGLRSDQVANQKVSLKFVSWNPKSGKVRGLKISGASADVAAVLRELKNESEV